MSRKFSKVEIEAFRAYNNKHIFNLESETEALSNLVVIYAPNGTGKTSFFDAIEWTMSGHIKRISNNQRVREIAEQEKGIILKNKDSELLNGSVAISFSDGESIKVETKKLNGSRKTDYSKGNIANKSSRINLDITSKFIEKNLLTHDQVDRFLRFENSKGRYEALKVFWDFNNDTELYKSLLIMFKEVEIQRGELQVKQKELLSEIEKYNLPEEIATNLENYTDKYNKLSESRIPYKKEGDLENLLNLYINEKNNKEKEKNIEESKLKEYASLFNTYETTYKKAKEELTYIQTKSISEIERKVEKLKNLSNYKEKLDSLTNEKNKLIADYSKAAFLKENTFKYSQYKEEKDKNLVQENKLIDDIKEINRKCIHVQLDINKNKALEEDNTTIKNLYKAKLNNLEKILDRLSINEEIKELNKKIHSIEIQRNNIKNTKEYYQKKINSASYLFSLRPLEIVEQVNIDELSVKNKKIIKNLVSNINEEKELKEKIKEKERILEANKKIGNDLNKLKKIGISVLQKTKQGTCPLCKKEHHDFLTLLNEIESENFEYKELKKLSLEIENLYLSMLEKEKMISEQLEDFRTQIQSEIKEYNKSIQENVSIINRTTDDIGFLNLEKQRKLSEVKEIEDYKKELNLMNTNPQDLYEKTQEIKKEYILKYNERNKQEWNLQSYMNEKTQELLNYENRLAMLSKKIDEIQLNNKQLDNNPLIISYEEYKKQFSIVEFSSIDNVLDEIERKKKNNMLEIIEAERIIKENRIWLLFVNEEEIYKTFEEIKSKRTQLEYFIHSFENELFNTLKSKSITHEEFSILINKSMKKVEFLDLQYDLLIKLTNTLGSYANNTFKKEKEKELKEVILELRNISKHLRKITAIKKEAHEYIKEKINSVFNLDSINKIFQMINPHPKLKEIYFKLDETLPDGELGLNIMCHSLEDGVKETAPILYLSSAQVNVLSLSIFLASAIENTEEFNTILMDDPVQHLDGINILSFIDLLRIISFTMNKQIVISTHDQTFYNLCKRKIDSKYFAAKYFDLTPQINQIITKNTKV